MKNLTLKTISTLFPKAQARKYHKGQIICYQGDRPSYIYFVTRGHIRYYDIDEQGNEKILHIIGPSNIFPMLYAYDVTDEVTAFYATIDNAEVVMIPLQEFREKINSDVKFSNILTRWFLTEIDQLVYRISNFERTDSRNRVLTTLKYLAINYGHKEKGWTRINFPVTQQFIADLTGLTRETVSASMQELEKSKDIQHAKGRLLLVKSIKL